jgi:hypothetical protein
VGRGPHSINLGFLANCPPRPGSVEPLRDWNGPRHLLIAIPQRESLATLPLVESAEAPRNFRGGVAAGGARAAAGVTDADIGKRLPGNWKFNDAHGAFYLNMDARGTFATYRESVETSTYPKVFRKLPLSSGTWRLNNGQVVLTCTSSVYADRLYKAFPFTIRSASATELAFVHFVLEERIKNVSVDGKAVAVTQESVRPVYETHTRELLLESATFFEVGGKKIDPAELPKRLDPGTVVVVSGDGKEIDPTCLKLLAKDAIVIVAPSIIGPPAKPPLFPKDIDYEAPNPQISR